MRLAAVGLLFASMGAAAAPPSPPDVAVDPRDGLYHVTATFSVSQPVSVALAVLSDYEHIPRFMPDVRKSQVLERREGRTVVEQEAVARVMMFSRRVHLVLEIEEGPQVIRFRDRCGQSFERYEGTWTISGDGARATITYALMAKPRFVVPGFLLQRLLRRDAHSMIERLQREMAARAIEHQVLSPTAVDEYDR